MKNVIVNEAGEIKAILDWEDCSSNCAPYWDFSIALHDLSIDGKQKFLEGYEPDLKNSAESLMHLRFLISLIIFPHYKEL